MSNCPDIIESQHSSDQSPAGLGSPCLEQWMSWRGQQSPGASQCSVLGAVMAALVVLVLAWEAFQCCGVPIPAPLPEPWFLHLYNGR